MNHPAETPETPNLLAQVGAFAKAESLGYTAVDHTLYGAPLSLLYRGTPHSYGRSEPDVVSRRERFLSESAKLDALVWTEGLPLERSLKLEHTAFYAQKFICEALSHNPKLRVYLYETWNHLNASDRGAGYDTPSTHDWALRIKLDRAHYERLSDVVSTGQVAVPPGLLRLRNLSGGGCHVPSSIQLIPVGTAFAALKQKLLTQPLTFSGRPMAVTDLFENPYTTWPSGWPRKQPLSEEEELAALAQLSLVHPTKELDDIHPSPLGTYVSSLVHFAVLYGRDPVGLPATVPGLTDEAAHALQELVRDVVLAEPRTGMKRFLGE